MVLKRISQPVTPLDGTEHLDNITQHGVYHQAYVVKAKAEMGYPEDSVAGLLEVHSPNANMVYQRFTEFWSGRVWHRGSYRGNWRPWRKILTE